MNSEKWKIAVKERDLTKNKIWVNQKFDENLTKKEIDWDTKSVENSQSQYATISTIKNEDDPVQSNIWNDYNGKAFEEAVTPIKFKVYNEVNKESGLKDDMKGRKGNFVIIKKGSLKLDQISHFNPSM